MRTVEQQLEIVLVEVRQRAPITVALDDARGLTLASDARAVSAVPACSLVLVVVTTRVAAAAGVTRMPSCLPVMVEVTVSVAVMPWLPTVFSVVGRLFRPASDAVKVKSAGSAACVSVEVKWTVPV